MEYLPPPVVYLESGDVDQNGNIINERIKDKPVFIMIQAVFCHHCTTAKPEFLKLANELKNKVIFATIQADSKKPTTFDLNKKLKLVSPEFNGFPSYVLHNKNKKIPYDGNRKSTAMKTFIEKNL